MPPGLDDLKFSDLKWNGWRQAETTVTFAGGTTNAIGDFDGTGNPVTVFTVTGTVIAKIVAVCETDLTIVAGATAEVGTAKSTAAIIAQTAGDAIDLDEIWHDATPDNSVEASSVNGEKVLNQNVILTVATANITAGKIRFICLWKPVSLDGNVA